MFYIYYKYNLKKADPADEKIIYKNVWHIYKRTTVQKYNDNSLNIAYNITAHNVIVHNK